MTTTELESPGVDIMDNVSNALYKLSIDTGKSSLTSGTTSPGDSPHSLDADLRSWLSDVLIGGNPRVYIKLLVSNGAAGSIIGKGGATINDFQSRTYARIQLSKSQEFYPGTQDRTLLVSGRLKQVIAALGLTLDKLIREGAAPLSGSPIHPAARDAKEESASERELSDAAPKDEGARVVVKMLIPQPLCGIIIGKNGATVRAMSNGTDTVIRLLHAEGASNLMTHRIVTVTGTPSGIVRAVALLVLKQAEDPQFALFSELPSAFAASPASVMGPYYGSPPGGYPPIAPAAHLGGPYYVPAPPTFERTPLEPSGGRSSGSRRSSFSRIRQPHAPSSSSSSTTAAAAMAHSPSARARHHQFANYPRSLFGRMQLTITQEQASMLSSGGYTLLNNISSSSGARIRLEHGIHHLPGHPGRLRVLTINGPPPALHQAHARLAAHIGPAFAYGAPLQTPGFAFPIAGESANYAGQTYPMSSSPWTQTIAGCTYYAPPPAYYGPMYAAMGPPPPPSMGGPESLGVKEEEGGSQEGSVATPPPAPLT